MQGDWCVGNRITTRGSGLCSGAGCALKGLEKGDYPFISCPAPGIPAPTQVLALKRPSIGSPSTWHLRSSVFRRSVRPMASFCPLDETTLSERHGAENLAEEVRGACFPISLSPPAHPPRLKVSPDTGSVNHRGQALLWEHAYS